MTGLVCVAVLAVAFPAAAAIGSATGTPTQAYRQISHCLRKAGALKVKPDKGVPGGGTAYWTRPFTNHGSWVSWNFAIVNGRILSTSTSYSRLSAKHRKATNRCLKPVGGQV